MNLLATYWWIPVTYVYYTFFAWTSTQNMQHGGKWLWINFAVGAACPLWVIVARNSKDIIFDGMLYDNILLFSFIVTTAYLGFGSSFNIRNWIGVIFVVLGFMLMKVK